MVHSLSLLIYISVNWYVAVASGGLVASSFCASGRRYHIVNKNSIFTPALTCTPQYVKEKAKVKQSHYRHGQALRVPGS